MPDLVGDKLIIRGPDGRRRIELGLIDGEPAIRIFDGAGQERIRLGLERDVDEDPEYAGLAAELRLTATDDGGEVGLTAAHGGNASISVRGEARGNRHDGAGAWIEANRERIEANFYDVDCGTIWSREEGRAEVRSIRR
ncbi:MAG: hypothetical protein HY692_02520 [Cyanobacteria bacterium NC_groundwater_1444_Ag_S-0.65um_54_12]|nr:hypothetical protein [Cyanobacteria bacterium NC_groundwater_1444_Ag_S-0.65um_54_12]